MASNNLCDREIDLPVIDLSLLNPLELQGKAADKPSSALLELISKIKDACEQWGFFSVINHGFEAEVIQRIESACRDLFALPYEVKDKVATSDIAQAYVRPSATNRYIESMNFFDANLPDPAHRVSGLLWPDGNPRFCKAVEEYGSEMDRVAKTLIKLILMGLGSDIFSDYYESFFTKSFTSRLRVNYYAISTINQTFHAIPMGSHRDLSFATVLYSGEAGLEVQSKEGDWFRVKHMPNSFAVNIGDGFKVWSNCRYRSAPHRVVYEGWSDRLSVVYFVSSADEVELYAPEELVDDDHPRLYRPFIFKDYKEYIVTKIFTCLENETTCPFLLTNSPPNPTLP